MRTTRQTLLRDARDPENARAWEEFFDQYSGPVQRYAQKLGLSAADASDVLQETMMELIRILPEFHYDRRRGLFRNFVLTIAHHRVQAAWRRRRRLREISWEEASGAELEEWSAVG
ncbi:MAG: sigma-70 family RNA polymerase sigma factor, partial [Kiritimatiellae bacterium]|nr:sigma-70 family RNA polymerase sigma factor [Kiritimatiellia bacterium]